MIFMDEKTPNPPILHYVPLLRRKKGESPFVESPKGLKVVDIEVLKESFTTPLTKITKQEIEINLMKLNLPQRQTKDGFDPKAYKLMAKIETPEEEAEDVPQSLEDGGQSTGDEPKEVNLGTIEEPRPTFISASLSSEKEGKVSRHVVEVRGGEGKGTCSLLSKQNLSLHDSSGSKGRPYKIMPPILFECQEVNVTTCHLIDEEDWCQPIIEYLEHGMLPKDSYHKTEKGRANKSSKGSACRCLWSTSSLRHSYILAAIDYFSKWVEVIPLREAKKENVADFIRTYVIYQYDIPHRIMKDNGSLAEAFNKTLCNVIKKIISKSKWDWQERISEALWAYRTTYRSFTGVTPYSLVYDVEVIFPLEREIPSLRMAVQEGLTTEDNIKLLKG
ncbi:uncharacterized protein E5676_scaffold451G00780 [Cucumis melo var. makuwa]|uniref:Integrase catalytic domain-containing protein n=1 Tax=Cucumis melo var. makuwa TaxID=1194695 RepID=A0A5D3BTH1_CUCMM|nr:uncharacterized protein E6C27_scaffold323G00100 [Cucumis melo var. makuwa]TYK01516.1 uncharacterized protein E5676_scaffold451G00780 [Cucumis melo var. makuwa]